MTEELKGGIMRTAMLAKCLLLTFVGAALKSLFGVSIEKDPPGHRIAWKNEKNGLHNREHLTI